MNKSGLGRCTIVAAPLSFIKCLTNYKSTCVYLSVCVITIDRQVSTSWLKVTAIKKRRFAMRKVVLYIIISIISIGFPLFLVSKVSAAENLQQERCAAVSCSTPTNLRPVSCELITVQFQQVAPGPVHYEVWIGDKIVLQRTSIKRQHDTYRTCRSLIERATKVVLCSKTSGGQVIATENPVVDFMKTLSNPLVFTEVPKAPIPMPRRE